MSDRRRANTYHKLKKPRLSVEIRGDFTYLELNEVKMTAGRPSKYKPASLAAA